MLHKKLYVKVNPEDDLLRSKRVVLKAVHYYYYYYYVIITYCYAT